MSDNLDKNIKKLLEKAPEPESWREGAPDDIFNKVQKKLQADEQKTAEPVQAIPAWGKYAFAAAAIILIAIVVAKVLGPKPTIPPEQIVLPNNPVPVETMGPKVTVRAIASTDASMKEVLSDGSTLEIQPGSRLEIVTTEGRTRPLVRLLEGSVTCDVAKNKGEFRVETSAGSAIALGTKYTVSLTPGEVGNAMSVVVLEGVVMVREKAGAEQVLAAGETVAVGGKKVSQEMVENWRSGQLVPKLSNGEQGDPMEIRKHVVNVNITDQVALIEVDQTFYNPSNERLEGTFFFPLPHGATICRLAMYVGDNLMEGEIAEAQRARRTFEALKVQQIDPALLEWAGGNNFKMRVFPIEPKSEKRVLISYFQVLKRDEYQRVRFSYPLVSDALQTHPVGKIEMNVEVNSSPELKNLVVPGFDAAIKVDANKATVNYSAEKTAPTKDFAMEYTVARGQPEVVVVPYWHAPRNEGYFLMLFSPELETAGETSGMENTHFVFVVDKSGGLGQRHLNLATKAVKDAMAMLRPEDRFSIVAYDTVVTVLGKGMHAATKENVEKAGKWLDSLKAFGASDLTGVWPAVGKLVGEQSATVVYAGSGMSSLTTTRSAKLLDSAKTGLGKANVRIHTLPIGTRTDQGFLQDLARDYQGTCRPLTSADDATAMVPELMTDYAWPIYRDIKMSVNGVAVHSVYPNRFPNVPAGRQFLAFGMYKTPGSAKLRLTATCQDQPFDKTYDVSFTDQRGPVFVPKLWATRKIEDLQNKASMAGGAESGRLVQEVVETSKRFRVMSHYTSFLVLETPEDYLAYGIERRRDEFAEDGDVDFGSEFLTGGGPENSNSVGTGSDQGFLLEDSEKKEEAKVATSAKPMAPRGLDTDKKLNSLGKNFSETKPQSQSVARYFGKGEAKAKKTMEARAGGVPMGNAPAFTTSVDGSSRMAESEKSYKKSGQAGNWSARNMNKTDVLVWGRKEMFPTFPHHRLGKRPKNWKHSDAEALKILGNMSKRVRTLSLQQQRFNITYEGKETKAGRHLAFTADFEKNAYLSRLVGFDQLKICDGKTTAELYPLLKYAAKRNADKEDLFVLSNALPALLVPWVDRLDRDYRMSVLTKTDTAVSLILYRRNREHDYMVVHMAGANGPITKIDIHSRRWRNRKYESYLASTIHCEGMKDFDGVKLPTVFRVINYGRNMPKELPFKFELGDTKINTKIRSLKDVELVKAQLERALKLEKLVDETKKQTDAEKDAIAAANEQILAAKRAYSKVSQIIRLQDLKVNAKLDKGLFKIDIPKDWAVRDLDAQPHGSDVKHQSHPVNVSPHRGRRW